LRTGLNVADEVKRVVLDADCQALEKKHGLRDWVEKGGDWPSDHWNKVIGRLRDLYIEAELEVHADNTESVVAGVADLVVRRQTFISYFIDGDERWYPDGNAEWESLAEVVARLLVQRYYREMQRND